MPVILLPTRVGRVDDTIVVRSINHDYPVKKKHTVVSNGSCTTNCLAPLVKPDKTLCGIRIWLND